MEAVATFKRVGQIGINSGMIGGVIRYRAFGASNMVISLLETPTLPHLAIRLSPSSSASFSQCRHISQFVKSNERRWFPVDTLALVRKLEAEGLTSKQAEIITATITEVLNGTLDNISLSVASKVDMQKSEMVQESKLSELKSEVKISQEHHFSSLQNETEKLRNDIQKMRIELRNEIDKVTAGQRLDLNLEKGRIRDELANQSTDTSHLSNKVDREINALKAQLEAAKFDLIKYYVGTFVSISAVGLAVVRILL